jgi:hypothetical protein
MTQLTPFIRTTQIPGGISDEFRESLTALCSDTDQAKPGDILALTDHYFPADVPSGEIVAGGCASMARSEKGVCFPSAIDMMADRKFKRNTLVKWATATRLAGFGIKPKLFDCFEHHAQRSEGGCIAIITHYGALTVRTAFGGAFDPLFHENPVHETQKKVDEIVRGYLFNSMPTSSHEHMEQEISLHRLNELWKLAAASIAPSRTEILDLKTRTIDWKPA